MSRLLTAGMALLLGLAACSSTDASSDSTTDPTTSATEADASNDAASGEGASDYDTVEDLRLAATEAGLSCENSEETELGDAREAIVCEDGTALGTFWNVGFLTIGVRDFEADDDTPVLHGQTWAIIGEPATDLHEALGGELKAKSDF